MDGQGFEKTAKVPFIIGCKRATLRLSPILQGMTAMRMNCPLCGSQITKQYCQLAWDCSSGHELPLLSLQCLAPTEVYPNERSMERYEITAQNFLREVGFYDSFEDRWNHLSSFSRQVSDFLRSKGIRFQDWNIFVNQTTTGQAKINGDSDRRGINEWWEIHVENGCPIGLKNFRIMRQRFGPLVEIHV